MKRDLYFSRPVLNASGSLGFTPDTRTGVSLEPFGAFVTNPFSLRPRLPAAKPEVIEYPGGFLLHTGLPNPGLNAGLKKYSAKWSRADLPIIVHLMADRPEETQLMVRTLESPYVYGVFSKVNGNSRMDIVDASKKISVFLSLAG